MTKLAYAYSRFSTKRQAAGHSLTRQTDKAARYAAEHGLTLVESYEDLGLSGYTGENFVDGKLGAFYEAVKKGKVPKGSYLLIESLDRMSRQKTRLAMPNFLLLVNAGIKIVTLLDYPPTLYTAQRIDDNEMMLFASMMVMNRAHEESKTKGARVQVAWDAKRASGKPMTVICPYWLTLSEDRSHYVVNTEKAQIVQGIFEMASKGYGVNSMTKLFNQEKRPLLGNAIRWEASAIGRLLHNRAVIGDMVSTRTGNVSQKYYPPIISEDLFYSVQEAIKIRTSKGAGRKGASISNLFSGIMCCGKCGSRARFVTNRTYTYLHCRASLAKDPKCTEKLLAYEPIEEGLLGHLFHIHSAVPVEDSSDGIDPIVGIRHELDDRRNKLERYLDEFEAEEVPSLRERIKQRVKRLTSEIDSLERTVLEHIPNTPTGSAYARAWNLYKRHVELEGSGSIELREVRLQLQAAMQPLITKITLLSQLRKEATEPFNYYRELEVHGPVASYIKKSVLGHVYNYTDDGAVLIAYLVRPRYAHDAALAQVDSE